MASERSIYRNKI